MAWGTIVNQLGVSRFKTFKGTKGTEIIGFEHRATGGGLQGLHVAVHRFKLTTVRRFFSKHVSIVSVDAVGHPDLQVPLHPTVGSRYHCLILFPSSVLKQFEAANSKDESGAKVIVIFYGKDSKGNFLYKVQKEFRRSDITGILRFVYQGSTGYQLNKSEKLTLIEMLKERLPEKIGVLDEAYRKVKKNGSLV